MYMCKYFAHGIQCPQSNSENNNVCIFQHNERIKQIHDLLIISHSKGGKEIDNAQIRELICPNYDQNSEEDKEVLEIGLEVL